ncbi:MAG: aminopeptidase [Armatimonadetes bacterium]|nr:aminopeptidase [Armatimonadota bacterium]
MSKLPVLALAALFTTLAPAQNPFQPPRAKLTYAPDRTCDLVNVSVTLDVDAAKKTFTGRSVNTLVPLRSGLKEIVLHAGTGLDVRSVKVDGKTVTFTRKDKDMTIAAGSLKKGVPFKVETVYSSSKGGGRDGGWHWMTATTAQPGKVGFWTQGETMGNCEWCPTWDYPNDLATSQTTTTVPADWDVVGNGVLTSSALSPDKKRKTFVWTMTQPHATYLLSLCGGPFDIKKDTWEGVPLWYVVPKGSGYLIDSSFGHTKDMLTFFSQKVGVKYPWPKYAQNAMYDFGGGMENVSATTLGEGSLTEERDGYYTMDSLNSHELGHQWFGDLVTCVHWGDIWLNESFATFMQMIYSEHSRGADDYAWEIEDAMQAYFGEARRYKHPLSTKVYPNPDAMFDSHTYPKGGVILHTLRRKLGDEATFSALKSYLNQWRHTPVESTQLRRAFTETTGVNAEPFWAQWIEKPGHPVLDYTWTYDGGKVLLTVKQKQDTSDGTPVYDIVSKVGLIGATGLQRVPVHITKTDETFEIPAATRPKAVVIDPDHDFLRAIPELHWADEELPSILRLSPNAPDRQAAMIKMLEKPDDAKVRAVVEALTSDKGLSPAFRSLNRLAALARPDLRAFWTGELSHANYERRAQAVSALAKLPQDPATVTKLRGLISAKSPIQVVVNAINALKAWDAKANADVFKTAQGIKDRRNRIKRAADSALGG